MSGDNNICELCGKSIGASTSIKRHQDTKTCREVKQLLENARRVDSETIQTLTKRVEELEREKLLADEHIKEQLETVRAQTALETKLELAQVAIEKTEERALRLEKHILTENSKPRTNITMNLTPYCSTEELAQICATGYTVDHFNKGFQRQTLCCQILRYFSPTNKITVQPALSVQVNWYNLSQIRQPLDKLNF